jgi:hypothetical protein
MVNQVRINYAFVKYNKKNKKKDLKPIQRMSITMERFMKSSTNIIVFCFQLLESTYGLHSHIDYLQCS